MTLTRFKCLREAVCCKLSPISLLPYEEYLLKKACVKLGINCNIKPGYTIFDKRTGVFISLSYVLELNNGVCPFLRKNNCLIHDYYKPLVCRAFPYVPKEVKYLYNSGSRIIIAYTEYGLSRKCPVIEYYMNSIERNLRLDPLYLHRFMPEEVNAAMEMERKRSIILSLLSTLWRKGILDLELGRKPSGNSIIVNVYDVLRNYYPDLPFILGIHNAISKINKISV